MKAIKTLFHDLHEVAHAAREHNVADFESQGGPQPPHATQQQQFNTVKPLDAPAGPPKPLPSDPANAAVTGEGGGGSLPPAGTDTTTPPTYIPPPPPRTLPPGWTARFEVATGRYAYLKHGEKQEQWEFPGTETKNDTTPGQASPSTNAATQTQTQTICDTTATEIAQAADQESEYNTAKGIGSEVPKSWPIATAEGGDRPVFPEGANTDVDTPRAAQVKKV